MFAVDPTLLKDSVDKTQQSWLELMVIMQDCNDRLFSSKNQTTKLVQNEAYILQIHQLQPLLYSWLKRFNALDRESHIYAGTAELTSSKKSLCIPRSSYRSSIITSVSIFVRVVGLVSVIDHS